MYSSWFRDGMFHTGDLSPALRGEGCCGSGVFRVTMLVIIGRMYSFNLRFSICQNAVLGSSVLNPIIFIQPIEHPAFARSASYIPATKAGPWNTKINK